MDAHLRQVVRSAVSQNGSALQDASAELRADRELALAAVSQDLTDRNPSNAPWASQNYNASIPDSPPPP